MQVKAGDIEMHSDGTIVRCEHQDMTTQVRGKSMKRMRAWQRNVYSLYGRFSTHTGLKNAGGRFGTWITTGHPCIYLRFINENSNHYSSHVAAPLTADENISTSANRV